MKTLIVLFASLVTSVTFAQDKSSLAENPMRQQDSDYVLQGKVTDLITGDGIGIATIEAFDSDRIKYRTLSNPDGSYLLKGLPRRQSLVVQCSQLGYSPNPKGDTANFRDGKSTWSPRLVKQNGDSGYLHSTAKYLTALPSSEQLAEAKYISVNLPPASRSVVASELQMYATPPKETVALFKPGPVSDEEIRKALNEAVNQVYVLDKPIGLVSAVTIEVQDGNVKLGGVVKSQADKELILARVKSLSSPVAIANNVQVLNRVMAK